ncbi:GTP-binding protein Di-Ras2-like, partial [Limulus polyphemus]|uniref:GTP-binding protein Di-Ras2-like n=1 Tax=Limulus polyphemus TaxID=6850 RepID=A0ABM1C3N3_LIMPO
VISCNKNICTLQITDTTGSHQFPAMQRLNISKGHAFVLVYSVTSKQSLEELKPIFDVIKEVKENTEGIPMILVGNKCDETENREVDILYGSDQARRWSCGFMETSAKTNMNVQELFQELLSMEKSRPMNFQLDSKKYKTKFKKDKLKGKCVVM